LRFIGHKGGEKIQKITNNIFIAILLLCLTVLFGVSTVSAETIYVNDSSGNDDWSGADWTTAKKTIGNATGTVQANGIVQIANGEYKDTKNVNLTLDRNMTIVGESQNSTIINGTDSSWMFNIIDGVNVTFFNLTFTNGVNVYPYGGAVTNQGTLTVNSCIFTKNSAQLGGALKSSGDLTVLNCTFTENKGSNGGAIQISSGICTVTGCNFINNSAPLGSVIYNWGTLTANWNRFYNNSGTNVIRLGFYGSASAENNWWGSNNPNWGNLIYGFTPPTNWVILSVNATPTTITNGETSTITADFNHVNGGGDLTGGHIPDGPITLEILWGSLNTSGQHLITLNTVNGSIDPVTFYANEGAINPLFNPVRVCATADGYTTSDSESAYIYINPVVNLTINKTAPGTIIAGTPITYTVTIHNEGLDDATDVLFTDTFITGDNAFNTGTLQYRWKSNDGDWSAWSDWTDPNTPLSLDLGTILTGKNATIQINGTINASTTWGTLINNTATTNTTTTPGDKTANIETTVHTQADIDISKKAPATVIAGERISYTITVTNNGPSDAQNIEILDVIPAILEGVTHDSFNLGTLAAGESRNITINGTVPSNIIKDTIIQNNASGTSSTPGTVTPSQTVTTIVDTIFEVVLTKIVDNLRPDVGDIVTFTVTAHNNGPSDALNIQIQDIMPSDFTDILITPSKGTYDAGTGIWTLNLISSETATLNLTGKVSSTMAGKNTTNIATLMGTTEQTNATIYVPKADLYIQITSDKNNPQVGETFTLTYKLGNNGPDDATNVSITIPLPDSFVILKIEGDGDWIINGNIIIWTLGNVTVGDPYLYISGRTTSPGTYQFNASIASETFSINSRGVISLSLNALPQVNAATSNTVGMQNTGMSLVKIVFTLLMVFCGFIGIRKKQ